MGRICLTALALVFVLGGCGGGGGSGGGGSGTPAPSPAPALAPAPAPTPAATLSYIYAFTAGATVGGQPNGPLVQASDGNFYGTTRAGGANACMGVSNFCGTVFKLTPGGVATGLYSFGASGTDGFWPSAPLVEGSDGALYGMTGSGGAHGRGTIFKITPGGTYTQLYSFGFSANDGATPSAGLIQAADGNFYGVTNSGGANHCVQIPISGGNCGTVFRMTPGGAVTVLHSFGSSASDGIQPNGSLLQASDGNFYGTTVNGGANSCTTSGGPDKCGTVFRMSPAGVVTILHSFGQGMTPGFLPPDGVAPQGPLIQGTDGALYGTTVAGGQGGGCGFFGCGTVFRITPAGQLTILYAFATSSKAAGYGPGPNLIQARDGNFYGTTNSGGAYLGDLTGTVFRLTPSGAHSVLTSFGPIPTHPHTPGGLIQATDGAFYGLTAYAGDFGAVGAQGAAGTVFKLVVP